MEINEKIALNQLEQQENVKKLPCGLFIHKKYKFIGASPDGVIDEIRIVEIKCPISGYKISLEVAVKNRKITFWTKEFIINKKHPWYLQVQGQLNITGCKDCLFGVWTGANNRIKTETIICDQNLWNNIMVPKLKCFYIECMLPEICFVREVALQNANKENHKRKEKTPDKTNVKSSGKYNKS
ncbi:unnamed protein product [Euphydryas editha]|uniref:YqaJ viral recombinase domain-containing protein n=1 Tax=Euphydryas editha TaxID=104508 RepID=A0AAU9UEC5_EUPED|nr:unnamed protein product [Euphydryas editha]